MIGNSVPAAAVTCYRHLGLHIWHGGAHVGLMCPLAYPPGREEHKADLARLARENELQLSLARVKHQQDVAEVKAQTQGLLSQIKLAAQKEVQQGLEALER